MALNAWIATESPGQLRLEVVRRPAGSKGSCCLPKRSVVERTLAWLVVSSHSKDMSVARLKRIHDTAQCYTPDAQATSTLQVYRHSTTDAA